MLCPCLFVISFFPIHISCFCILFFRVCFKNYTREREEEIRLLFSSRFYCLYFIFQFWKDLEGKKKIYLNIILMYRIYMLATYFIRRKTISRGEMFVRKSKHGRQLRFKEKGQICAFLFLSSGQILPCTMVWKLAKQLHKTVTRQSAPSITCKGDYSGLISF